MLLLQNAAAKLLKFPHSQRPKAPQSSIFNIYYADRGDSQLNLSAIITNIVSNFDITVFYCKFAPRKPGSKPRLAAGRARNGQIICQPNNEMGKTHSFIHKLGGAATALWHLGKRGARHIGLPLVYAGVLLMGIFYFTGLTHYNLLLLLPLLLILMGIVGFVHQEKGKNDY